MTRIKLKSLLKEDAEDDVTQLITKVKNYDEFVAKLGDLVKDDKVRNFLNSGKIDGDKSDDSFTVTSKTLAVKDLRPTQNEIDIEKSLKYPLTNAQSLESCLKGVAVTLKAPIVTYKGEFIIDGHHRWSQLYAVNSKATITSYDLTGVELDPIEVLKVMQLGIGAELGKLPTGEVGGPNLLTAGPDIIKKFISKTIIPDCISVFKRFRSKVANINTADGIADGIILPNVEMMKRNSKPVPGAPKRPVMPQTDDAPKVLNNLKAGLINYNKPYNASTESIYKEINKILQKL